MSSILNVCRSLTICILLANFIRSSRAGGEVTNAAVMSYLQQESAAVTSAQHAVQQMLLSKNIPVGLSPLATQALRTHRKLKEVEEPYRIALSTDDNDITCRISLVNVPVGKKCVAPCGCSGSQEWVQFTELNRLRRLDPSQWTVCQTCRKKFDYSSIQMYGGVKGNIISLLLDNMKTVRIAGVLIVAAVYSLLHLNSLVLRFLTSKFFWQMYPKWSRVIHLPLVLKLWFGKIAFDYGSAAYLSVEKHFKMQLTEVESSIVEPNLPVTVSA